MKKTLLFWFALMSLNGIGQNLTLDDLEGKELHNKIRLNYILIHQPTDQVNYQLKPTMGFIGLNYNFPLNNWLYTSAFLSKPAAIPIGLSIFFPNKLD